MTNYEFHPAANIFPLEDETLDALASDIKENGQQCPIEIYDGKIVDGRRRFMACRIAGVEADVVEVEPGDPVSYVLSLNLHRRHLTASQKAMVAARAREQYDKEAKERQKTKGGHSGPVNLPEANSDARDAAGKTVGVSGRYVDHATKILKSGDSALIEAVDKGEVTVNRASTEILSDTKKPRKRKLKPAKISPEAKRGIRTAVKALRRALNCVGLEERYERFFIDIEAELKER